MDASKIRTGLRAAVRPLLFVVCLISLGCGKSNEMTEVFGTITMDGVPVPDGVIQFRNAEGEPRCYEGKITEGTYNIRCEPGPVRVEILGFRNVPGKTTNVNGISEPLREMHIPKKYNEKSTLTTEVKRGETSSVPFELTSH